MKNGLLRVSVLAMLGIVLTGCPFHPGRHGPRPGRLPVVVQPVDTMQQAEEREQVRESAAQA